MKIKEKFIDKYAGNLESEVEALKTTAMYEI
jgi:hypothetical protein